MPNANIVKFQSKTYTVDEFEKTLVDGVVDFVEERMSDIVEDMRVETEKLLEDLKDHTAEPRASLSLGTVTEDYEGESRRSPMRNLVVFDRVTRERLTVGRYSGRYLARGTIQVRGPRGLENAFNAMDSGIPERSAKSSPYMRFPRYEGNHMQRSGSLGVGDVSVGDQMSARSQMLGKWVTVKKVAASEPFNLFDRLRRRVRDKERKRNAANRALFGPDALGLSKIKISVAGILEE